ncbi:hypothetical protein RJ639_044300 [Escallonia herrerae]|uniref:Uncharacterized protein n=1 Tax=Escallonia herrerae TaxID=1293975 RepID=A0AA88WJH3_9ASTE|nr:hypothetical protein RJ639_044300 [Escallonia herrerae]
MNGSFIFVLQRNFAPVEEIGNTVEVDCLEGEIPADFPEGVYVRNGANPLHGGIKSTISVLGRSEHIWVEGEGMLHALYFTKTADNNWKLLYKNKFVESDTFKLERKMNKPGFLPAIEGDALAILAGFVLNTLSFGIVNKILSNTNVFEHAGKYYSVAENYLAQEINISGLETLGNWDFGGAWGRPFTSRASKGMLPTYFRKLFRFLQASILQILILNYDIQKAPGSGELVITGVDAVKQYYVVGVVSADGKRLNHKVDLNTSRSSIAHEVGVTEKLVKFEGEKYSRIGVMPRYGNADSVRWFEVGPNCTFHMFNCFEDGNEVVVRGCKAKTAIIPGPDWGQDKFEWFSRGFKLVSSSAKDDGDVPIADGLLFSRVYEQRLNLLTGEVKEIDLSGDDFSMDFPTINGEYIGVKQKYGYTQVIDSIANSSCGKSKYGGLTKLYFEELEAGEQVWWPGKIMICRKEQVQFGAIRLPRVSKPGAVEEDDGWIVAFVHDEDTDTSHVLVVDAKNFEEQSIAKIALPQRVPYGHHHGAYFRTPTHL